MAKVRCIDPTVGDILSGWRYDISGLHSEMRTDYDIHLSDCRYCHARQNLHRAIDVVLISSTTVAMAAFLLALIVLHQIQPLGDWVVLTLHVARMSLVVNLEVVAILGLMVSLMAWILVAIITPAPTYLTQQARALQERLPEELRDRLHKLSA